MACPMAALLTFPKMRKHEALQYKMIIIMFIIVKAVSRCVMF